MNNIEKLIRFPNRIPVANISALRQISGKGQLPTSIDYAIVLGKNTIGDGYAREYYWDQTSTANDNDDSIIRPAAIPLLNAGRWLLVNRQNNVPRTFTYEFIGNSNQISWLINHNLATRNLIVQVNQIGGTGQFFDIAVETEIKLYDDSIEITFHNKVPGSGEHYRVLATEVII